MASRRSLEGGDAYGQTPISVQLPRAASFTFLPVSTNSDIDAVNGGIKRTFSENALARFDVVEEGASPEDAGLSMRQKRDKPLTANNLDRRKSTRPTIKPKITISKFALSASQGEDDTTYQSRTTSIPKKSDREAAPRSVSRSLSGFARKSWISASRSPSPGRRGEQNFLYDGAVSDGEVAAKTPSPPKVLPIDKGREMADSPELGKSPSRKGTVLVKKSHRPLSAFLQRSTVETGLPRSPSLTSLRKSLSNDKLPSLNRSSSPSEKIPPMPRSTSTERLQNMGLDMSKKKDELWSTFRALDGHFQK